MNKNHRVARRAGTIQLTARGGHVAATAGLILFCAAVYAIVEVLSWLTGVTPS